MAEFLSAILPPNNTSLLVDIGSDLGFLGLELLKQERVKEVWNIELSKVSLENSRELYLKRDLDSKTRFIYSDGFSELISEELRDYQEIVIVLAGLGSKKIISILEGLPESWKTKKIWLCCLPHAFPEKLRAWIERSEWEKVKEESFSLREKSYVLFLLSNL
nr:tRNA (adenine(22)-N(1))-methyltransferase TrmK [Mycoplasma wenyonii]